MSSLASYYTPVSTTADTLSKTVVGEVADSDVVETTVSAAVCDKNNNATGERTIAVPDSASVALW